MLVLHHGCWMLMWLVVVVVAGCHPQNSITFPSPAVTLLPSHLATHFVSPRPNPTFPLSSTCWSLRATFSTITNVAVVVVVVVAAAAAIRCLAQHDKLEIFLPCTI
jgi:hypothetical protein